MSCASRTAQQLRPDVLLREVVDGEVVALEEVQRARGVRHGLAAHDGADAPWAGQHGDVGVLPMIFISGVFYDVDNVPSALRDIAEALPLVHVIDGLSAALVTGEGLADLPDDLVVIALWTVAGIFFAVRGFTWTTQRD